MANSRYKYFNTVWNSDIQHTQKGMANVELFSYFKFNDDIKYEIPLIYRYRPDKIAKKFYGNSKLFWVLVYANEFSNSPEDFEVGEIIRVPKYERIVNLI